jgi:adenosylhomocysteine nucleosidase
MQQSMNAGSPGVLLQSSGERDGVDFVFVAALEREVGGLVRRWSRGTLNIGGAERTMWFSVRHRAVLVCAGTGWQRAYEAAKLCVQKFSPRVVVSIGFAGSCVTELAPGSVFVPGRVVVPATGKEFACTIGSGTLVSLAELAGIAAKREARKRYGAVAVEMESAGVATAAGEHGTGFAAIKAISDGADDELDFLSAFVTPEGFATGRFLAHIALRPALWPRVAALQRNSRLASQALEQAVGACCINGDAFAARHS